MSSFFARPQLLRVVSRVTRNHAGANALRNHVPESRARRVIVAQQCVQADLVVRAVLEPPSRRKPFSVSLAGPPTKPLTRAVGQTYRKERLFKNEVCSHYHERYKTNFVRLMCLPIRSILPLRRNFFGERGCTHSPEVQPTTIHRQIGEND